ncbi:hypothetical protein HPB51_002361 [Rhipicephalus microplus]|uniref:Ion transport domain-containing protein n=1 Tax=Rhipicephalus microplus TaxID=6941 RepID=A0A9J6DS52_RHIMP|nr:hypothetical protein HPB51_002361 [Rhipicephalus microplus]
MLASQRIETVVVEWFGTDEMKQKVRSDITTKRGASPSIVEWIILAWVIGLIWSEMKQLWDLGLIEYVGDMWNIIDFITNSLYVATVALRVIAYLQISLGRMVIDIVKFFFVYTLVLFAFACGMNQLLCLFESSQTLFWASFGLIDLDNFELSGIQSYTRFWGLLMFGSYCVINVVVLLNLLIAMMNHSYQMISVYLAFSMLRSMSLSTTQYLALSQEHADVEWKFARCKLWMSNFEDGGTVPPPFNVIPTPKTVSYFLRWCYRKLCGNSRSAKKEHLKTIRTIMRNLVRRYITSEQRKADNQGVTEDDVNEIKQEISSFRYELLEVLKIGGFNTSGASGQSQAGTLTEKMGESLCAATVVTCGASGQSDSKRISIRKGHPNPQTAQKCLLCSGYSSWKTEL